MTEDKTVRKLRKRLETALAKRKEDDAIELLGKLIEAEPKAPRWPHKRGELYRKHNRKQEAIEAYTLAADLYADQGFIARAVAMAKTIIDMDPRATQVLARIDPEAARRLHRQQRPTAMSAQQGAKHPALLPEDEEPIGRPPGPPTGPARHAALVPEDLPGELPPLPPRRHAAVLPEDDELPPGPPARREEQAPARHPAVLPEDPPAEDPRAKRARDAGAHKPPSPTAARPEPRLKPAAGAPPKLPEIAQSVLELAEELTIAPDVRPNETRFSNAPPGPALKLDLTDLELKPRRRAQSSQSIPPPPPPARKLSQLPLFPLFAEVSQEALIELVKGSEVIELPDASVVMRRGDPADALWGIVEGSVEVVVPGQRARTTLAEGDVFGESCLLAGETRYADVVVRGHLLAIKVPRHVFNPIVAMYPRLAEVLIELLTRRLLGNLLQTSPLFQEFDGRGRQELARKFEIRRAPRGTVLAAAGKAMDGLYVNLTGKLEVSYADGRPSEQHESGTMFGQAGLLTNAASDITVRALANMLVLRLPAAAFHAIAMQYPGMLAHLSELAGSSVARIST